MYKLLIAMLLRSFLLILTLIIRNLALQGLNIHSVSYQYEDLGRELLASGVSNTPSFNPTTNQPSYKPNPSKIVYVSFISSLSPTTNTDVIINEYKDLMKRDDSPFTEITLPWSFSFLGENIFNIFISPNGGLHRRLSQPCYGVWGVSSLKCYLMNNNAPFYNLIGGLYADLNPTGSLNGNITSYYNDQSFTVNFENIVYYGTNYENSFRITLFKDNHIEISYDKIFRNGIYPNTNDWLSGLRSSPNIRNTDFTLDQINIGIKNWATSIKGIYPSPKDIVTGKQFNICPISKNWCLQPKVLNYNLDYNKVSYLNLTSLLLSCRDELDYGIILYINKSLQMSVACKVITDVSIHCSLTDIFNILSTNSYSLSGIVSVQPAWKVKLEHAYNALNSYEMKIEFVNSTDFPIVSCDSTLSYANSTCFNNCTICEQDYSCLYPECESLNVFDHPNCNNECPSLSYVYDENYYDVDNTGLCCSSNDMSCMGICDGNDVLSINTEGAQACCLSTSLIDCAGVCDGTALKDCKGICNGQTALDCKGICGGTTVIDCKGKCGGTAKKDCKGVCEGSANYDCAGVCNGNGKIDFCGVCNGMDFTGTSGCLGNYSGFNISTNTIDNGLYPVFKLKENYLGMYNILPIYILNDTPYNLKIKCLQDPNLKKVVPEVSFDPEIIILNPKTSSIINISISLIKLLEDKTGVLNWGVRSIFFQYGRTNYKDENIDYPMNFNIYSSTMQCDSIKIKEKCTTFPGCIFCMEYPTMRILLNNTMVEKFENNASNNYIRIKRKLFTDLLPPSIVDDDSNKDSNEEIGYCIDGWDSNQCHFNSSSYSIYSKEWIIIYTIISILFTIFIY